MGCVFCAIAAGEVPARIVAESGGAVAFLDASPLARGHALVVPRRHYERVQDMPPGDVSEVFGLAARLAARTDALAAPGAAGGGGGGSTLIAVHNGPESGQEVPHVHVHLVPRRRGDGAGPVHSMFGGAAAAAAAGGGDLDRVRDELRLPG